MEHPSIEHLPWNEYVEVYLAGKKYQQFANFIVEYHKQKGQYNIVFDKEIYRNLPETLDDNNFEQIETCANTILNNMGFHLKISKICQENFVENGIYHLFRWSYHLRIVPI